MNLLPGPLGCGLFVGTPQEEDTIIGVGEFALRRGGELGEEVGGGGGRARLVAAQDNGSRPDPVDVAGARLGGRGHRGEAIGGGDGVVDEVASAQGRARAEVAATVDDEQALVGARDEGGGGQRATMGLGDPQPEGGDFRRLEEDGIGGLHGSQHGDGGLIYGWEEGWLIGSPHHARNRRS